MTFTDVVSTWRCARSLASSSFDLCVAHGPTNGFGLVVSRLDAPLVLVYHPSPAREARFVRARHPLGLERLSTLVVAPPLALYERATVSRADMILALSAYSRDMLVGDHPRAAAKARCVPGGVDTDAFSPGDQGKARVRLGLPTDRLLLVTVRRLEPRMGIEELLRALRRLPDFIDLAVVVEGTLAPALRRLADELGLGDRARFVGLVSEQDLVDWYRAADAFVLPTIAYEGFGLVTVESLGMRNTGRQDAGRRDTPELLMPLDPRLVTAGADEALARAVDAALAFADPELRARCRRYALERFSWEPVVDQWEASFDEASRTQP